MKFDLDKYNEYAALGFCYGKGNERSMVCVEAAVCIALGEGFKDRPSCVDSLVQRLTISLNDMEWSNYATRAAGMRYLGLAGLGTKKSNQKEEQEFQFLFLTKYLDAVMLNLAELIVQGAVDYPELAERMKRYSLLFFKFKPDFTTRDLYLDMASLSVVLNSIHDAYQYYTERLNDHDKNSRAGLVVLALRGLVSNYIHKIQHGLNQDTPVTDKYHNLILTVIGFFRELSLWAKQSQLLPVLQPDIYRARAADLAIQVLQEMGHTNEFEELWGKKPKQEG